MIIGIADIYSFLILNKIIPLLSQLEFIFQILTLEPFSKNFSNNNEIEDPLSKKIFYSTVSCIFFSCKVLENLEDIIKSFPYSIIIQLIENKW
jgi:hypothetical protein